MEQENLLRRGDRRGDVLPGDYKWINNIVDVDDTERLAMMLKMVIIRK